MPVEVSVFFIGHNNRYDNVSYQGSLVCMPQPVDHPPRNEPGMVSLVQSGDALIAFRFPEITRQSFQAWPFNPKESDNLILIQFEDRDCEYRYRRAMAMAGRWWQVFRENPIQVVLEPWEEELVTLWKQDMNEFLGIIAWVEGKLWDFYSTPVRVLKEIGVSISR
ncbi:MAG: hypothetical protein PHU78_05155 [Heliobacteriaceae bacterium]|nr:hypothetical protein [Heliobacteriaceae bacterium]